MAEPVTTAEAIAQCRLRAGDDDDYVTSLIAPARAYIEREISYALVQRQFVDTFSCWRDVLLYRRPVISIDGISYTDTEGTTQTLAAYFSPLGVFPVKVLPAIGSSFPVIPKGGSITVTYTAGFADADVSAEKVTAKQAVLLLIEHWYDNRGAVVVGSGGQGAVELPFAVRSIIDSLRPIS